MQFSRFAHELKVINYVSVIYSRLALICPHIMHSMEKMAELRIDKGLQVVRYINAYEFTTKIVVIVYFIFYKRSFFPVFLIKVLVILEYMLIM